MSETALAIQENGAVADFGMRTVVSVDQAIARNKELQRFVAAVMVRGEDYGVIPGTGSKPSLFKPGAEKLCEMYGLVPTLEVVDSQKDWENGFFYCEVKCTLVSKHHGGVVAEGLGSCNSKEKRYRNQDVYSLANTILKMAKKRAHVDAALSATRSSGIFTQDVEDIADGPDSDHAAPRPPQRIVTTERPAVNGRAALEKRYRELVDKADALGIPADNLDPKWSDEDLTARGRILGQQVKAKEETI